jgi:hypothetical protein
MNGGAAHDDYIVVGDADQLATSVDGITWTKGSFNGVLNSQCSGAPCSWTSVAASATAAHKYVAIGTPNPYLQGAVAYSDDTQTWTAAMNGPANAIDVIWDGTRYVTAGVSGEICSSPDGAAWSCSTVAALGSTYPSRMVYTGSTYVIVGLYSSKGLVATSPDLATWTIQPSAAAATSSDIMSVAYANGLLVAGTQGSTIAPSDLITSSDQGVTWMKQPSATALGTATIGAVGWTGTWWVAVVGDAVIISKDAVTWEDDGPTGVVGPDVQALGATTLGPRGMVILMTGGIVSSIEK